jgi:hypothetical protein
MGHHPSPALTSIRHCRTFAAYTFIETTLFSRRIPNPATSSTDPAASTLRKIKEALDGSP